MSCPLFKSVVNIVSRSAYLKLDVIVLLQFKIILVLSCYSALSDIVPRVDSTILNMY